MNALTEKAGPLPVWGWMVAILVLILGGLSLRAKASAGNGQASAQANAQALGQEEAVLAQAASNQSAQQAQIIGTYSSGGGTYGSGYFPAGTHNGWSGGQSYQTAPAASSTSTNTAAAPTPGS